MTVELDEDYGNECGRELGDEYGFDLVWRRTVKELQSVATLWQHKETKSRLLSFCNRDENKVFAVSFRTPPKDSTGVAHILEHSVLNGSQKYPSKEPFVELLKGSLQTFLNAFTYPDKTCYPVASANLQDFYNLVDVYLDAVFHPLITQSTFEQEGWHVEATDKDAPLSYKGVVYNEMKGVYSSPDSILSEQSQQSLFPDITYGLDSGGSPNEILKLTYQQFCDFHANYYHPVNGHFFFWGDDPEAKRLEILGAELKEYKKIKVDSEVKLQPAFKRPHFIEVPYAVASEDIDEADLGKVDIDEVKLADTGLAEPVISESDADMTNDLTSSGKIVAGAPELGKHMLTMNWLLPQTIDAEENFTFQMLDHILTGLPGSPLRRALIESGLGEDITGGGLENELREMYYSIGLRGVAEENIQAVEVLIMETLAEIEEDGVPAAAIEAAVNSVEFALRENNTGRFPVGLAVMLRSLSTWLYGGDPLALLSFEGPLAAIKAKIAKKEPIFENLIKKWFLKNKHRSTVVLIPDPTFAAKQEQAEKDKLDQLKNSLSPAELEAIITRTKELKAMQEAPEDPAALAAIPQLTLKDLPLENRSIPRQDLMLGTTPVFFHDQPTAGIVYVDLLFNMAGIAKSEENKKLIPLLPLFGRALLEMGTKKRSFVELGNYMAAKTGGLDADPVFLTRRDSRAALPGFLVSGKATAKKLSDLYALFGEVLLETEFDDQERFIQMALEEKARQEQDLIPAGHSVVALRLQSRLTHVGALADATGGIDYLDYLRELADRAISNWQSVLHELSTIRSLLFQRGNLSVNLTTGAEYKEFCEAATRGLLNKLPGDGSEPFAVLERESFTAQKENEALLLPAQVNYVGQGINLYELGYKYHGSVHVILKYLRTGFLWEEIRVKGGAYGAISSFDRMNGVLCLVSYRDPNVKNTLDVYARIGEHLSNLKLENGELESSIIGAIGELDTYLLPDAKGSASFTRYLTGDTEEARQEMRNQILGTTLDDFKAFGQVLTNLKQANICMLGGAAVEEFAKAEGIKTRKA